jgi:hypothetical protein
MGNIVFSSSTSAVLARLASDAKEVVERVSRKDDPKSRLLSCCAVIYRRDSQGAYENILSSCLEVRAVR